MHEEALHSKVGFENFGRGPLRIFPLDGQIQGEVFGGTTMLIYTPKYIYVI